MEQPYPETSPGHGGQRVAAREVLLALFGVRVFGCLVVGGFFHLN